MIHSHIGNNRYYRHNDIGGIIKSTHPDFNHCIFYTDFGKIKKGHRREKLKFRRCFISFFHNGFRCMPYRRGNVSKVLSADILSHSINTFCILYQMRRYITPCLNMCRFQCRSDHGGCTSFAIGPCDMNYLIFLFRVPQILQ